MPTLGPGWNSVPRCRTMMLPGQQRCPPYSLTPRYLGSESLVFCVEPPCFLDAQRSCCHCRPAAAPPLPPPHELLQASAAAALRAAGAANGSRRIGGQYGRQAGASGAAGRASGSRQRRTCFHAARQLQA